MLKLISTSIFILMFCSYELIAQLNLSDTLIFQNKNRKLSANFEIYPDSTFFYFTKTFPKYHSRGTIRISYDTLTISSLTNEKNIEDSTQTPLFIWQNLDLEKFLIEKDVLLKLPDKKEKFKLKKEN